MKLGELYTELRVNNGNFKRAMSDAKNRVKRLDRSMERLRSTALGFLSFGAMVMAVRRIGRIVGEQERSSQKLAAVLRATGGAAGLTAKQLEDYAQSLQSVTTFSNDAIVNTEAILATFKEISGPTFKRAIKATMDMSATLGQDLRSSAIQLGKALNDPILGVTALRRVGVQLTRQQEDSIRTFMEQNNVIAAQNVILRELETQMGGTAEAMAEMSSGRWAQMMNAMSDLLKAMLGKGSRVSNVLASNFKAVTNAANGMTAAINESSGALDALWRMRRLPAVTLGISSATTQFDMPNLPKQLLDAVNEMSTEARKGGALGLGPLRGLQALLRGEVQAPGMDALARLELRQRIQANRARRLGPGAFPDMPFPKPEVALEGEGPDVGLLERILDYEPKRARERAARTGMAGTAGIADFAREMQRAITQGQMDRIAQDQLKEARLHTEILRELVSQGPGMAPLN